MPFMQGASPIRRTLYYLEKGEILLRKEVRVIAIGYSFKNPEHKGARDFVYWHWAQLQFKNESVQLLKLKTFTPTPYILAFLEDGRQVTLDLYNYNRDRIVDSGLCFLNHSDTNPGMHGKDFPRLILESERVSDLQLNNPANFGEKFPRQCMCEIQGQRPCASVCLTPKYLKANWRWNFKGVKQA
uniref:Small ribosomal subunit protein mS25 n=1 Tax=Romanomermis culicivorax TaxID=13658 RepID=A0A915KU20_ROMCU